VTSRHVQWAYLRIVLNLDRHANVEQKLDAVRAIPLCGCEKLRAESGKKEGAVHLQKELTVYRQRTFSGTISSKVPIHKSDVYLCAIYHLL